MKAKKKSECDPFEIFEGTIAKLSVSPGDILVLTGPYPMSLELADRLKAEFEKLLGGRGVKCVVLGDGLSVSVVTAKD